MTCLFPRISPGFGKAWLKFWSSAKLSGLNNFRDIRAQAEQAAARQRPLKKIHGTPGGGPVGVSSVMEISEFGILPVPGQLDFARIAASMFANDQLGFALHFRIVLVAVDEENEDRKSTRLNSSH